MESADIALHILNLYQMGVALATLPQGKGSWYPPDRRVGGPQEPI